MSGKGFYFDSERQRYIAEVSLRVNGHRIRRKKMLPLGTTASDAQEIAETLSAATVQCVTGRGTPQGWVAIVDKACADKTSWAYKMFARSKSRSADHGRQNTLTLTQFTNLLYRSNGKCQVTGIEFTDRLYGNSKVRPLSPSLDRIDSAEGYRFENCRIVCAAVNIAMNSWGSDVFRDIALGYVMHRVLGDSMTKNDMTRSDVFQTPPQLSMVSNPSPPSDDNNETAETVVVS